MYKKIKNTIFLLSFFTFVFLVAKHYLSDENILFTNKSRSSYLMMLNIDKNNLPTLKNDTNNIIVYSNGIEEFNKKRKKRFWEKLIPN